MSRASRRTLAAALATSTALAALFPVFQGAHWFWRVLGAVLVVAASGLACRAVRLPRLVQPVVGLLVLVAYLVLVFARQTLDNGLPGAATVDALRAMVDAGQKDIDKFAPPVPANTGVVLIAAAGAGLVALLVDAIAVLLDRVAVAGLPLLALFAVPSAVLPGGLGGVPFAIGATGWLLLLLEEGSDRVSGWGSPMRAALPGTRGAGDESSLGRVGRRIGVAAVGLAVIVPPLVPGLDHRLVGRGGGGPVAGDGGPSSAITYNPLTALKDQLTLPEPRQLLVYETDEKSPGYLRMTTLDTYTGNGWESSKLEADRKQARVQKGIPRPDGESEDAPHEDSTVRIAVDSDHLDVHWLPVPLGTRKVEVDGTWLWDESSQTVFSASSTTKRLKPYRVEAERVVPTRERLLDAAGVAVNADVAARYGGALQVSPEVELIAARATRGAETPYDIAVAIQRYFTDPANGFVYDTSASQPGPGQDALQAFLEGKHGFCEQYATAMAVLLRVAGIPSRVAVGFTGGTKAADRDGVYTVTTDDAHAWPEAWFAGSGWVRFEPTPAAHGASVPDYSLPATTVTPGQDGEPSAGSTPTPRPSASGFRRGQKDPDTLLNPPGSGGGLGGATEHIGRLALGGAGLLLLLASPLAASVLRRRARARHEDPLVAWAQLRDDACDVGTPWSSSDSPRAVAARLLPSLDPPAREALSRLATAAELARYAPPGRASGAGLQADALAVRRSLLASASLRTRWRALLLPPSTLRWAAQLTGGWLADVLDLSDRVFAAAFRPLRRVLRLRT